MSDLGKQMQNFSRKAHEFAATLDKWSYDTMSKHHELNDLARQMAEKCDPRFSGYLHTSLAASIVAMTITKGIETSSTLAYQSSHDENSFCIQSMKNNRPQFELTHGIAAELMLTDPSKVKWSDIAWPFDAFLVRLPSPSALSYLSPKTGKRVDVVCFAVTHWNCVPRESDHFKQLNRHLYRIYNASDLDRFADEIKATLDFADTLDLKRAGRSVCLRAWGSDTTSFFINYLVHDDLVVSEWFESCLAGEGHAKIQALDVEMEQSDKIAMHALQRLAVNLALYLCSEDGETGQTVWSPVSKSRGAPGTGRIWTVGQSVKVGPDVRKAAKMFAERGTTDPAWKLATRHIVRGHFRNQPVGPGRVDRRRIYIKPFWKGPVDGARSESRTYEVK